MELDDEGGTMKVRRLRADGHVESYLVYLSEIGKYSICPDSGGKGCPIFTITTSSLTGPFSLVAVA